MGRVSHVLAAAGAALVVLAVAGGSSSASQPRTASVLRTGICVGEVPKTARAGDTVVATCRFTQPLQAHGVVVTPAFSDAFAEPTRVLQPVVDFAYQLDLDSGSSSEFLVLIRILRDLTPSFRISDVDYHAVIFRYLATGTAPA